MQNDRKKPFNEHLMRRTTGNIFMVMAVVLTASMAVVSCRKTEVEVNGGLDSGESVSEGVPMTFSVSSEAHQSTKAVLVPDDSPDGNKLSIAGNQITVYDRLTVGNRTDLYINGRDAEYRNDPQIFPDGTVTSTGWHFMDGGRYWTRSGTHLFTAFLSGYHVADKDEPGGSFFNDIDKIIADPSDPSEPKLAVEYNDADGSLKIENWRISTSNQFDFMYASHTRNVETAISPYAPVPLKMEHLFTAVQFNITNMVNYYPDSKATRFILNGLNLSGSATVTPVASGCDVNTEINDDTGQLTVSSTSALAYNQPYNVFANVGNIGDDGCLLIWPHSQSKLEEASVELHLSGSIGKRYKLPLVNEDVTRWDAGNRYIYNFYIQDNRITFTVEVVGWIYDDVIIEG